MHKTRYKESQATSIVNDFWQQAMTFVTAGSEDTSDLIAILSALDELESNSNIMNFLYAASLVMKMRVQIGALIAEEETIYAEDVHYMNNQDQLVLISRDYYNDADLIAEIQKNNGVYSTDDAIKKGILKLRNFNRELT